MAFIPLYDGNPLRYIRHPWVAWGLIAVNAAVFFFFEGGLKGADEASVLSYGLIPALVDHVLPRPDDLAAIPEWATLFTYSFLHADFWHLGGNMIFLWVFADNVEDCLGHVRFLIFYVICAIAAGGAYVLSSPASHAPVIGASGAIAGVVAAYFLLYPYAKIWILAFGRIPLRLNALWVLGFWILFQVYAAFQTSNDDTAWWAHIGGLASGAILVLFLRRPGVRLFARPVPPVPAVVPRPAAPPSIAPPDIDGPWTRR